MWGLLLGGPLLLVIMGLFLGVVMFSGGFAARPKKQVVEMKGDLRDLMPQAPGPPIFDEEPPFMPQQVPPLFPPPFAPEDNKIEPGEFFPKFPVDPRERDVTRLEAARPVFNAPFDIDPELLKALDQAVDQVYLSDMREFATTPGPMGWKFAKNGHLGTTYEQMPTVRVNGVAFQKGLSMHPPFGDSIRTCYALKQRAKTLSGKVALNDTVGRFCPPTRFVILGDDEVLWRSPSITESGRVVNFEIDVAKVNRLELRTFTVTGMATYAHAVWLDPVLSIKK